MAAHIIVKIFSLDAGIPVELFDANGNQQALDLTFAGKSDTDRGEEQPFRATVAPGGYWLVEVSAGGSVKLSRVTARDGADPVPELIAMGDKSMKDLDFAAFAGTCARMEIPQNVSTAFLCRVGRDAKDYLKARHH